MTDDLSRAPNIVRGPTASLPAPGAGDVADGAVVIDAPPVGAQFGIYRAGEAAPMGPFVMVEDMRPAVDRWHIRPVAWPAEENRVIAIMPLRRGHAPNEWAPESDLPNGYFGGGIGVPISNITVKPWDSPADQPPATDAGP